MTVDGLDYLEKGGEKHFVTVHWTVCCCFFVKQYGFP